MRFSVRPNRAQEINWREWGEEAFREARQQHKPVALFLVAFWCGVCQRLDETSLSSDEAIALLNAYFVPIRVEESQRPDVDLRYNLNGWPAVVFLTPAGDLLFSVNYLAPEPFVDLLIKVVHSWEQDKATRLASAARAQPASLPRAEPQQPVPLGPAIVAEIAGMVEGLADREHGGFGTADKLFHTEAIDFLLYLHAVTAERGYLDHVRLTLDTMRASRTYDARHGGFFRYSSRRDWQEPHPEKLLDDQAALIGAYLRAFLVTEAQAYRGTAEGLIDYLDTTLFDRAQGVFFGCQDYVRQPPPAGSHGPPRMLSLIDRHIYCDANARAASAYLSAWWLLGRDGCRDRARTVLEWLWRHLRAPDGGMYHYWDGAPRVPGLLMDAVMTGRACLDAYACLDDATYLDRARQLADEIERTHRNPAGGYFDAGRPGPAALQVPMTVLAQNAALAAFFLDLAGLSGETRYRDAARWALQSFPNSHRKYGAFAAGFGHSLARLLSRPVSITVTGTPGDPRLRGLLRAALAQRRPGDPIVRFRADRTGADPRIEIGPSS